MVDSIENASVADTAETAWVRNRTSIVISSATSVSGWQRRTRVDAVDDVLDARLHQQPADLIDQRRDLFVEVDELVGGDAVLADLVERLDQLGAHDDRLAVFEPDDAEADHAVEPGVVIDQPLGVGDAHPFGLLGGPAARDRRFQSEHVADVLALLPRRQHLVHVGDVVAAVEQSR